MPGKDHEWRKAGCGHPDRAGCDCEDIAAFQHGKETEIDRQSESIRGAQGEIESKLKILEEKARQILEEKARQIQDAVRAGGVVQIAVGQVKIEIQGHEIPKVEISPLEVGEIKITFRRGPIFKS